MGIVITATESQEVRDLAQEFCDIVQRWHDLAAVRGGRVLSSVFYKDAVGGLDRIVDELAEKLAQFEDEVTLEDRATKRARKARRHLALVP